MCQPPVAPVLADPRAVVVQVGDLIDRGPDSPGVLAFVRARLEGAPERWVQLIGNHEWQYLGGDQFWPRRLGADDAALLRTWWMREWLRVASAVRTPHAGLTVDAWQELGGPVTAGTAVTCSTPGPSGCSGTIGVRCGRGRLRRVSLLAAAEAADAVQPSARALDGGGLPAPGLAVR
jgi:hypothetical protein